MSAGFPARAAAAATGLTETQVRRLTSAGVVSPSVAPGNGRGTVARYSYFDLIRLKVIQQLRAGGDITFERLALAMSELRKVRDGGWQSCLLYTHDWVTFDLCRDPGQLAGEIEKSELLVIVSLGAVDRKLQAALAGLSLIAPIAA